MDDQLPPLDAYVADDRHARRGPQRERPKGPAAFLATRLDETEAQPRDAIVQGLGFDRSSVAAIVGSPNAGKTAFALSLFTAVAAGVDRWLGLKIRGGAVLYFGAEAPGSVIMRARAAAKRLDAKAVPLYVSGAVPGLGGERSSEIDAERIIATIRQVQAKEAETVLMVGIDTLAACLADGDENGDGMVRLVNAAKRIAAETGVLVVLIHHPSKGDGAGLRGHGSLAAACDAIVRIETDELTKVRTATLTKARDCATGLQIRFELEPVMLDERDSFGDPRSTIVVRETNIAAPRPRPSGRRQQQLLDELERRYRTGEHRWDEATIREAGRTLGMSYNSAKDALRALVSAGYVGGSPASLSLKHPPQ